MAPAAGIAAAVCTTCWFGIGVSGNAELEKGSKVSVFSTSSLIPKSDKLKSKPLERSDADTLFAFLASQDGKFDSFTFIPPIISNTKGTASGTVTVNNAEVTETESGGVALSKSAGSRAVGITNSSETGTLKTGDKIKFSNHDKVYVLTADINLDGSTVNALQFYPPLTTAVTSSTTVTYENVPFKVSLMDDVVRETISTDGLYTIEFTVREDT